MLGNEDVLLVRATRSINDACKLKIEFYVNGVKTKPKELSYKGIVFYKMDKRFNVDKFDETNIQNLGIDPYNTSFMIVRGIIDIIEKIKKTISTIVRRDDSYECEIYL